MKKKMPSEGLRLGRDSGSILCDTLKKWRFRTGWGRGCRCRMGVGVCPDIAYFLLMFGYVDYYLYLCTE